MRKNKILFLSIFFSFWSCEDAKNIADITDYGIVINEINYNSSESFDPDDWIEIYNNSDSTISISQWLVKDRKDEHIFTIPQNTFLLPGQYLIFCKDSQKFTACFPNTTPLLGELGFGLSGGSDIVRLYDSNGNLADIVEYDDDSPWPSSADGNGSTIELKNPNLDNEQPENWAASVEFGTPGKTNSVFNE